MVFLGESAYDIQEDNLRNWQAILDEQVVICLTVGGVISSILVYDGHVQRLQL